MSDKPNVPPELDAITDIVLAYRPKPKSKAAKRRIRRKKREEKRNEALPELSAPQSDESIIPREFEVAQ
jgi:hypothetical protein